MTVTYNWSGGMKLIITDNSRQWVNCHYGSTTKMFNDNTYNNIDMMNCLWAISNLRTSDIPLAEILATKCTNPLVIFLMSLINYDESLLSANWTYEQLFNIIGSNKHKIILHDRSVNGHPPEQTLKTKYSLTYNTLFYQYEHDVVECKEERIERKYPVKVVAISGKMGTGKDYVAKNIVAKYYRDQGLNVLILGFADFLKLEATRTLPHDRIFAATKDLETRELLQRLGTTEGRDKYGEDVWIKLVDSTIKLHAERGVDVVIITDCRFQNEVAWVESIGGEVIRLNAPLRNKARLETETKGNLEQITRISSNKSETDLDNHKFKHIVDNDPGQEAVCNTVVLNILKLIKPVS